MTVGNKRIPRLRRRFMTVGNERFPRHWRHFMTVENDIFPRLRRHFITVGNEIFPHLRRRHFKQPLETTWYNRGLPHLRRRFVTVGNSLILHRGGSTAHLGQGDTSLRGRDLPKKEIKETDVGTFEPLHNPFCNDGTRVLKPNLTWSRWV